MPKHKPDYVLLISTVLLVIFGLVMIASVSVSKSFRDFGQAYWYFRHQLIYGVLIGLVGFFVVQKIPYQKWQKISFLLLVVSLGLLALVLLPNLGYQYGGAKRWLEFFGFSIQPSEIVKLTFVLYLAAWLSKKGEQVRDFSAGFLPFVAVIGLVVALLIMQPDVGTLGLIALTSLCVFFVAGARLLHVGLLILAGFGLFFGLIKTAPYRLNRFLTFLNPNFDPQGISYQINQALIALGAGGLFGLGLGQSLQKYDYLPGALNDSIFAIIGEEFGLIGTGILLLFFLIFAIRGFRIAKRAPDDFSKLTATGITSWLIFQALIHIAGLTGLIPLTGIPLPFISYGGSAMITSLIAVGILFNISKYTR